MRCLAVMENVGCRRRFDDVHALPLRATQRSPRDLVELMQGPEVSAMDDSDSADYEHIFTQWPTEATEHTSDLISYLEESKQG